MSVACYSIPTDPESFTTHFIVWKKAVHWLFHFTLLTDVVYLLYLLLCSLFMDIFCITFVTKSKHHHLLWVREGRLYQAHLREKRCKGLQLPHSRSVPHKQSTDWWHRQDSRVQHHRFQAGLLQCTVEYGTHATAPPAPEWREVGWELTLDGHQHPLQTLHCTGH